jgi:malate synthase
VLSDGRRVTLELFRTLLAEENDRLAALVGHDRYARGHYVEAALILDELTSAATCAEFLTVVADAQLQ